MPGQMRAADDESFDTTMRRLAARRLEGRERSPPSQARRICSAPVNGITPGMSHFSHISSIID